MATTIRKPERRSWEWLASAGLAIGYGTVVCLLVEVWLALTERFDIYRPLDLEGAVVWSVAGLGVLTYYLLWNLFAQASAISPSGGSRGEWAAVAGFCGFSVAVYATLPTFLPPWVGLAVAGVVTLSAWAMQRLQLMAVSAAIAQLVVGSVVVATLLLWTHEEANSGLHTRYARMLAERTDVYAEREIGGFVRDYDITAARKNPGSYWEQRYLRCAYLASNYFYEAILNPRADTIDIEHNLSAFTTTFAIEGEQVPTYRVRTPYGHTLIFRLNKTFRYSIYSGAVPYKRLSKLDRYQYAVVDRGELALANAGTFDLAVLKVPLPGVGQTVKIAADRFDGRIYRHDADTYVLIGEPLSEFLVWSSNLSLVLALFIAISICGAAVRLLWRWRGLGVNWRSLSLQYKMQGILLGTTLSLFVVVSVATFVFLHQNNAQVAFERQLNLARSVRTDLIDLLESRGEGLADLTPPQLRRLFERNLVDVDVYSVEGQLLGSSIASAANSPAVRTLAPQLLQTYESDPWAVHLAPDVRGGRHYLRTLFGLTARGKLSGIVALNTPRANSGTAQDIPIIMGKLLSVYLVLLLVSWAIGLLLIRMLFEPILALANRLQDYDLGAASAPLSWEGDDAIGKLTQAYNEMVVKVEQSTRALVDKEREGAWQVMAQQIAHEINNALTPLRLNTEYIVLTLNRQPGPELDGARRMSSGLIERIDHLSKVATQFKSFASLDTPHLHDTAIAPLLRDFVQSRQGQVQSRLIFVDFPGTDGLQAAVDPVHLTQVLLNLVTNADRAMSEEKVGQVTLSLKQAEDRLLIEVKDNGPGIPTELQAKLFDPRFTITSSQTGLGLAVSKRIVEFFSGTLSYETSPFIGTTFRIELPIVTPAARQPRRAGVEV